MKVYLIRHSEPDFSQVKQSKYTGYGRELTRLTTNGIKIANEVSDNPIFDQVQLLLISPYTRAMETAMEIVRHHDIPTQVELMLYEWRPDKTGQALQTDSQVKQAYQDYQHGTRQGSLIPETPAEIKQRVGNVLAKYKNQYDCLACVTHGEVIRQMTNLKSDENIPYCGIYEIEI